MARKSIRRAETVDAIIALFERGVNWGRVLIYTGIGGGFVWIAAATEWLDKYAPLSWWLVGLAAVLVASGIYWLWSAARLYVAKRKLIQDQTRETDSVNPLDDTFDKRRIKIGSFVDPANPSIKNKTFVNCELVGPANLIFSGGDLRDVNILDCDLIELATPDNVSARNAIMAVDCIFRGCTFLKMSLYFNHENAAEIRAASPNAYWLAGPGGREQDGSA